MTDLEIYTLASDIIEKIKTDFNNGYYNHLNGELIVSWSHQKKFNAQASSDGNYKGPPNHKITLNYELARIIYRDGEAFYDFINGPIEKYSYFFNTYDIPNPPDKFKFHERAHFLNNFLAAAITYIFAHEIGHLNQEHGHIRNKFGELDSDDTSVNECDAVNQNINLTSRQSAIWHATELAADYEATYWCITEMFRHGIFEPEKERAEIFLETAFIFFSALTCTHYRFNGLKAIEPPKTPIGSHPHPIYRIEKTLMHAIELIDLLGKTVGLNKTKRELTHYLYRSSTAANIFWISQYAQPEKLDSALIIGGVMNHKNTQTYMPEILSAWDDMDAYIKSIKRYHLVLGINGRKPPNGLDLGQMIFSENFRNSFSIIN